MKFNLNILTMAGALLTLSVSIPKLNKDVQSLSSDKTFTAALANAPHLQAAIKDISAKWRAVEGSESAAAHDKNFFSKVSEVQRLLNYAGVLATSVAADQADPDIAAEIAANAVLSAKLNSLKEDWSAVVGAFSKL